MQKAGNREGSRDETNSSRGLLPLPGWDTAKSERANLVHTVMVAESDDDSRYLLKYLLESDGYRVVEAGIGQEAVIVALRERPDLILLEIKVPLHDGFSTVRRIRQDAALRDIPIVALSAFHPSQHRTVALAAGCSEYVRKPIELNHLENLIARLLTE